MPVTQFTTKEKYRYQNGFDSHLEYVFHVHLFPALLFFAPSVIRLSDNFQIRGD